MYNGSQRNFLTYSSLSEPIEIALGNHINVRTTHYGLLFLQNLRIYALHTPTFHYSLLSVSALNLEGYEILFDKIGTCTIRRY